MATQQQQQQQLRLYLCSRLSRSSSIVLALCLCLYLFLPFAACRFIAVAPRVLLPSRTHSLSCSYQPDQNTSSSFLSLNLYKNNVTSTCCNSTSTRNSSTLSLPDSASLYSHTYTLPAASSSLSFSLPLTLDASLSSGLYTLSLSSETTDICVCSTVNIKNSPFTSFIQTDRPVYRPSQAVDIGVLAVDEDGKFVRMKEDGVLEVHDPSGFKMMREAHAFNRYGIFTSSYSLSSDPVLGVWTIHLLINNTEYASQQFTVAAYVLPIFSVEIEVTPASLDVFSPSNFPPPPPPLPLPPFPYTPPPSPSSSNATLMITVHASYTYGEPVVGSAIIRFSQRSQIYYPYMGGASVIYPPYPPPSSAPRPPFYTTPPLILDSSGNVAFTFDNISLISSYTEIEIDAIVVESGTNINVTSTSLSVPLYMSPSVTVRLFPQSLSFKPSLPLSILLVSYQQTSTNTTIPVNSTYHLTISYSIMSSPPTRLNPYPSPRAVMYDMNITTINGISVFSIPTPLSNTSLISVSVYDSMNNQQLYSSMYIDSEYSPSMSYVSVALDKQVYVDLNRALPLTYENGNTVPQAEYYMSGDTAIVTVRVSSNPLSFQGPPVIHWSAICRGNIIDSGVANSTIVSDDASATFKAPSSMWSVSSSSDSSIPNLFSNTQTYFSTTFNLSITTSMSPQVKLIVWAVNDINEVIADYIPIFITPQLPVKLNLSLSKTIVSPSENMSISVSASSNINDSVSVNEGQVLLIGIDESILLLNASTRLNTSQVLTQLNQNVQETSISNSNSNYYLYLPYLFGPPSSTASDMFLGADTIVLTDYYVPSTPPRFEPPVEAVGLPPPTSAAPTGGGSAFSGNIMVDTVRKNFPETWIFKLVELASGNDTLIVTAPDTITNYQLQALALTDQGIGISDPIDVTVFQPFFISLNLPYSSVRGEVIAVTVAIHSYIGDNYNVSVRHLSDTSTIAHTDSSGNTLSANSENVELSFTPSSSLLTHTFYARPQVDGVLSLTFAATSATPDIHLSDTVIQNIIVVPPGIIKSYTINQVVELSAFISSTTVVITPSIPLEAKSQLVENSSFARIYLSGDILGEPLHNIDSLIQLPTGCGEQNMMIFAPMIYLLSYYTSTQQSLPEDRLSLINSYLSTGYQRELRYRHTDGSFSAFGMRDATGSSWLTAFILKCFSQAQQRGYIYIDSNILNTAISYINGTLLDDGSFQMTGTVVDGTSLYGGLNGQVSYTAYVCISLLESQALQTEIGRTITYLESQVDRIISANDVYSMSLVNYALTLAGRPSDTLYTHLLSLAVIDDNGFKHWSSEASTSYMSFSTDIESTSYMLLSMCLRNDIQNGLLVSHWLVSQRNQLGGYTTTQDTIIALEALSTYASLSGNNGGNMNVSVLVESDTETRTVTVDEQNKNVLQILDIPVTDKNITVTFTSTSTTPTTLTLQSVIQYNVYKDHIGPSTTNGTFSLSATYTPLSAFRQHVAECYSYTGTYADPGMVVLEIGVFSGYQADSAQLDSLVNQLNSSISKYEQSDRVVYLYYNTIATSIASSIESGGVYTYSGCIEFDLVKEYQVLLIEACSSRVYAYYHPEITSGYVVRYYNDSLEGGGGGGGGGSTTTEPTITPLPSIIPTVTATAIAATSSPSSVPAVPNPTKKATASGSGLGSSTSGSSSISLMTRHSFPSTLSSSVIFLISQILLLIMAFML